MFVGLGNGNGNGERLTFAQQMAALEVERQRAAGTYKPPSPTGEYVVTTERVCVSESEGGDCKVWQPRTVYTPIMFLPTRRAWGPARVIYWDLAHGYTPTLPAGAVGLTPQVVAAGRNTKSSNPENPEVVPPAYQPFTPELWHWVWATPEKAYETGMSYRAKADCAVEVRTEVAHNGQPGHIAIILCPKGGLQRFHEKYGRKIVPPLVAAVAITAVTLATAGVATAVAGTAAAGAAGAAGTGAAAVGGGAATGTTFASTAWASATAAAKTLGAAALKSLAAKALAVGGALVAAKLADHGIDPGSATDAEVVTAAQEAGVVKPTRASLTTPVAIGGLTLLAVVLFAQRR